ncbi:MPPED1 [Symbiodinium sp. CCMP2456]|nr:MPPED1 [Symbiodinium sp. CCMP2456]
MGQHFSGERGAAQYTPEAFAVLAHHDLYASGEAVRIIVMSDTHNTVRNAAEAVRVPTGDVFIHCGDVTVDGTAREVCSFNEWLGLLPHQHRIVIAGNHDLILDPETYHANVAMSSKKRKAEHAQPDVRNVWSPPDLQELSRLDADQSRLRALAEWRGQVRQRLLSNATAYLEGERTTLAIQLDRGGNTGREVRLHIAGAPHTDVIAASSMRAFAVDEERQLAVFCSCLDAGPLDVLITHGPPYGVLDRFLGVHTGSKALVRALSSSSSCGRAPSFHVFGHVHKQKGVQLGAKFPNACDSVTESIDVPTTFVNAASVIGIHHRIRDDPAVVIDIPIAKLVEPPSKC